MNLIQNEIVMYDWTLRQAREAHHATAIQQLEWIGQPDSRGVYPHGDGKAYEIAEEWMDYFGGDIWGQHSTDVIDDWMLDQPEYSGEWGEKWRRA